MRARRLTTLVPVTFPCDDASPASSTSRSDHVVQTAGRAGASLLELIAALGLFGITAAAMVRALDRQARFHAGITQILETGTQLAATHDALAVELRGLAGAAGDVESVTDSSVVYRAQLGSGITCSLAGTVIDLPAQILSAGTTLTHFASAPQPGDTAWLFDDGALAAASDDRWVPATVVSVARQVGACIGTGFVDPQRDAASLGWRVTLGGAALPSTIAPGAVVRFTRRSRFALYRASTGETFLGWTEWNTSSGGWNVIQPLSGPFLPFNRGQPSASGVAIQAHDSTGAPIGSGSPTVAVAGIGLFTRAGSRRAIRMDGVIRGVRVDSLGSFIAVRNRG